MKVKYYIWTTVILILAGSFIFYYILIIETKKLPFRSNPRYELTAYFQLQDQIHDSLFHIKGRLYATFNKNGYCKLIQKYEDKMIFNDLRISEGNISQLNQFFTTAPIRKYLIHTGQPRIYDGPMLRLDYINDSEIKTLYFISVNDSIYNRVFEEIYSYTIKIKRNTINDTIMIKEMRLKMLVSIRNEIKSEFKKDTNYSWDILE